MFFFSSPTHTVRASAPSPYDSIMLSYYYYHHRNDDGKNNIFRHDRVVAGMNNGITTACIKYRDTFEISPSSNEKSIGDVRRGKIDYYRPTYSAGDNWIVKRVPPPPPIRRVPSYFTVSGKGYMRLYF